MAKVQGKCDKRFQELERLLKHFVETGEETGASVCVNLDGEDVVDIWGGYVDEDHSRLWEENTITNLFSTTKNITALAALILVERKLLDVEEKVCHYWPDFAANGKEDVKIKHILSHTSGVSGWEEKVSLEDVCESQSSAELLARQKPWWTPGSASGYHSLTMGHLVGEVVRRITGNSLGEFVTDQIAKPLNADFQIGAKASDWERISNLIPPPPPPPSLADIAKPQRGSIAAKTFLNPLVNADFTRSAVWRNADLGAANGHGNARSIARILSVISLGGTVPGLDKAILSTETINLIFEEQASGEDLVIRLPVKFGIGFGLAAADTFFDMLPRNRICFWSGWGGSFGVMDLDKRLTVAYAMNKMDGAGVISKRAEAYLHAVYRALGEPIPSKKEKQKI